MMPSASGSTSTLLLARDTGEMGHQHVGIDTAQVKTLAARQHRDRHFADFGGGEDEFGVLRRLFQRLQERVEGRGRQHVDFVDDVDLVARAGRRIAHAVIDLADVVDAGMGGGVHLQHVHMPAFHDRLAVHAERRHRGWSGPSPSRRPVRNSARGRGCAPWWFCRRRARRSGSRPAESARSRTRSKRCGPWPPGRSDRRNWRGGICAPARDRACRPRGAAAEIEAALIGAVWSVGVRECQRQSSVDPQLIVSRGRLAEQERNPAPGRDGRFLRNSLEKTGRRLTSDPIRTSLGLLPSGPDPVGEWLVHRQSPGPYLGPKGPESKRGAVAIRRKRSIQWLGRSKTRSMAAAVPASSRFRRMQKRRGCPA